MKNLWFKLMLVIFMIVAGVTYSAMYPIIKNVDFVGFPTATKVIINNTSTYTQIPTQTRTATFTSTPTATETLTPSVTPTKKPINPSLYIAPIPFGTPTPGTERYYLIKINISTPIDTELSPLAYKISTVANALGWKVSVYNKGERELGLGIWEYNKIGTKIFNSFIEPSNVLQRMNMEPDPKDPFVGSFIEWQGSKTALPNVLMYSNYPSNMPGWIGNPISRINYFWDDIGMTYFIKKAGNPCAGVSGCGYIITLIPIKLSELKALEAINFR